MPLTCNAISRIPVGILLVFHCAGAVVEPAPFYPITNPVFETIAGPGNLKAIGANSCVNNGDCPAGANVWITNLTSLQSNGQTLLSFSVAGGEDGLPYDVFAATSITQPLTNGNWTWMGQTHRNETCVLPVLPDQATYLLLGTPLDSDGDGLTDAYELLVSHSDPHDPNSINPSMLDGWAVALNANPFAIYDQQEFPGAPCVRLDWWRFDTNTLPSESGLLPLNVQQVSLAPDWSGSAVEITNAASWLNYPAIDGNGFSFDPTNGTMRFWFMPFYSAGNTNAQYFGTFFDYGANPNSWTFYMINNEFHLSFGVEDSPYLDSYFLPQSTVFSLQSNLWYQIAIVYSPSNVAIYTNGSIYITSYMPPTSNNVPEFALGNGLVYTPTVQSLAAGFSLGDNNRNNGGVPINGLVDNLETFNYPLSPQEIAAGYPGFSGATNNIMTDSDYDGRSDLLETLVDGTNPDDPNSVMQCRLGYWRFDSSCYLAEQGQLPLSYSDVSLTPGWSGTALNISSEPASQITYWDVFTNGWANINCRQGALRFWFKPNWNGHPGNTAPFVYMGNPNPALSEWALNITTSGQIEFVTASNSAASTLLTSAPLPLDSGHWMQIVFDYGPDGTRLYTNGILAATGRPVTAWPPLADRNLGMVIGNNAAHNASINGQFDEIETFNYELNVSNILANFQTVQAVDGDLDGIPDLIEDVTLPAAKPYYGQPVTITGTVEAEQFDIGGPGIGYYSLGGNSVSGYRTNGLFITNCDDRGLGYCLDRTRAGEWAQYTINVLVAETYNIEARVEGIGSNGIFECEFTKNGFYTNTGPLTIPGTNWTNVSAPVFLTNGVYTMKLRFLTNGSDGRHVGKFNYISIYPWWPMGFVSTQTNVVTAQELSTNNDFLDASNNAAVIQQAINTLPASGGTVLLPAGTYYVSQSAPNEDNDFYQNAALTVVTNNIEIAGAGKTNTTLIAYNRATTILSYGQSPQLYMQCSNFVMRDLTLQAQPHLAVFNVTNTFYEQGQLTQPFVGRNYYTGFLTVFKGYSQNNCDNNIVISNCQFLYADFSIGTIFYMSNCLVTHCDFTVWGGSNIYTGQVNSFPTNTLHTVGYDGSVGIFGAGAPNYNMVIVDNNYNGNTNLAPSGNNPFGYVNTSETQFFGPDGFVYFQSGGNFFIGRNNIANYELEAVQISGGPSAIVDNDYHTLINDGSACALAFNASGFLTALGTEPVCHTACFIGNAIYGGRNGDSSQGEGSIPVYALNFSGNDLTLDPPLPLQSYPGAAANLDNCQIANIAGNTLETGGHGAVFNPACGSAVIANNNFAAVTYRGIGLGQNGGFLQNATIVNNILGCGSTFHVQMPIAPNFGWFLRQNQCLNASSNIVPPFVDPPGTALHVN